MAKKTQLVREGQKERRRAWNTWVAQYGGFPEGSTQAAKDEAAPAREQEAHRPNKETK